MAAFIIYIIRWGVVLTLLYSLYGLLMKRETLHGFNRVVLLVILAASMVLPLVHIETSEDNIMAQGREMIEYQISHVQNPLGESSEQVTTANHDSVRSYAHAPVRDDINVYILIAIAIYLVGLIVCWLRYLLPLVALVRLICKAERVEVDGLPKHVAVLTHPDIKTPCSWMRWIMLPAEDASLITPLSSRNGVGGEAAIVNHELAHIRLGHSWDMMLCELTCRMLWPVPFAWMLRQDLRDVHEYQADRDVLRSGIRDEEYQLLLIKKATSAGLQPVVNALNQSPIKRRFKMMYQKPSRRWVALKAAYLLPLSALALVAFARPQTLSEIEQKVEKAETEITQAIEESGVMETVTALAENLGLKEREEYPVTQPVEQDNLADSTTTTDAHEYLVVEQARNASDANLVRADLAESRPAFEPFNAIAPQRANELLDSTMQAVGARKIADGTWIGHFQPSLNNDTVRLSSVEYLDKQSRLTGRMSFPDNVANPYAYTMTLQQETRKDRTGYYIRFLQPATAKERDYDQPVNDPYLLSTDEVLTGRDANMLLNVYEPVAIERSKKETRIYMYSGWGGNIQESTLRQATQTIYKNLAIVDEHTSDRYVCRSVDYSYFKHVKDEYLDKDTIHIYQLCLVFPPLDKHVENAYFGHADEGTRISFTFNMKEIPNKARIITE